MAFQAGAIVSQLTLDKSKFSTAIKGVKKETTAMGGWVKKNSAQFKRMGLAITAMGTAALFTFKKMVDKYVEVGDMVDKMSKRTAFAAETISELAYAADISGADISMLEKGVKKMSKTIVDASYGLETYLRVFRSLGLEVEDLMELSPEEQFMKIGSAIADMENDTLKTAAAVDVFGRSGTMLLPLFKEGAEGIAKLRKEARELGIIFDEEAAAKAAKLKDAQTALKAAMQGLGIAIVEDTIPVLTQLAKHFTDVFINVRGNAQTFTTGILTFLKAISKGVMGLMLAWNEFQRLVFEGAGLVTAHLQKMVYQIVEMFVLMEKLPIIGAKFKGVTDFLWQSFLTLDAITQGYNETADATGEKMADIIVGFEKWFAVIGNVKGGLEGLKQVATETGETIVETILPATNQVTEALEKLASKQGEATSQMVEQSKELTKAEVIAMGALMAAYQGGIEGMISYFENIAIAALLKWIFAEIPFPFSLIAAPIAMMAAKKLFEGLKSFEEGGRIGREGGIVGEKGPEYFAPARPGTIIPLTGAGAGLRPVEVVIAPSFHIEAIDEYSVKRFIEEKGAPALIEMLKNKRLLDDFQKALGV